MRRSLLLLLPLLLGCPTTDPPDVILWDDDASASIDDDDDSSGDDDDVAPDDDDAGGPDRSGVLWLLDRQDLTTDGSNDRLFSAATFALSAPEPMQDYEVYLGLPLPGLLLHPDLTPELEDGEGCVEIQSTDGWASVDDSVGVGDKIQLAPDDGPQLDVALEDGIYRLEADGPPEGDSWDLEIDGDGAWPASVTADVLDLPPRLDNTFPTPGTLGVVSPIPVSWQPEFTSGVEVLVVRFDSPSDTNHWTGVRCLAVDDGNFTVHADALASSGTGDIQVSFARASWTVVPEAPAEGRPALHAGAITAVSFRMTVGGR